MRVPGCLSEPLSYTREKSMTLRFSTPGRRVVHRRHVNHRNPTTIREKLITGLLEMGYKKTKSISQYEVFARRDDQNWYVGDNGALRIGRSATESRPANALTRELILTAPVVRPLVRNWLDEFSPSQDDDPTYFIPDMIQTYPQLAQTDSRILLHHIKDWKQK